VDGHLSISVERQRLIDEYIGIASDVSKEYVAKWNKHKDISSYLTGEFQMIVLMAATTNEEAACLADFAKQVTACAGKYVQKTKEEKQEAYEEKLYATYIDIVNAVSDRINTAK